MNLKNYTSEVPVGRSVGNIEKFLMEIGATKIMKEYDQGGLTGMSFEIPANGIALPIKIPANVDKVYDTMVKERSYPTAIQKKKIREQAERTTWKTIHEWVVIQCQMVLLNQAELSEVFMPYIWSAKEQKTFFQKATDQKLLTQ